MSRETHELVAFGMAILLLLSNTSCCDAVLTLSITQLKAISEAI